MPTEKKPKESYQANYQGATPKQAAQALLKYRPKKKKIQEKN